MRILEHNQSNYQIHAEGDEVECWTKTKTNLKGWNSRGDVIKVDPEGYWVQDRFGIVRHFKPMHVRRGLHNAKDSDGKSCAEFEGRWSHSWTVIKEVNVKESGEFKMTFTDGRPEGGNKIVRSGNDFKIK